MSSKTGPDRDDVALRLRAELSRLKPRHPFDILGLPISAEADAVRQAFLTATKKHHPNRYARESPEARELATELFLVIRSAYEQLSDEATRRSWRERLAPASPIGMTAPRAHSATPPKGMPIVMNTPPKGVPAVPAATAATAPTAPTAATAPTAPTAAAPTAATTPPTAAPPTAAPPPSVSQTIRSRTAPPIRPTRPPTAPTTGKSPAEVQAMLEAAKTRAKRFEDAQVSMVQGRYRDAKEILQKLAAEDPATKKFRVQLHLATGLEHKGANRSDEAIRELERAVALDPECTDAAEALRKLQEQKKSGGFLSKFFGR
jgi:hypothetical protein